MPTEDQIYTYVSEILGYGGQRHKHVDTVIAKMGKPTAYPPRNHVWNVAQAHSASGLY
jgi:hypothetical protein